MPLPSWLGPMVPNKGDGSLEDEIKCYSLPYGGIGFLSHFLTYWAVLWLGYGRKPYFPWKRLSAGKFDMILSLIQIIVTLLVASFTISRCQNRWQFVLIATWKLVMSVEVGIWGMRASYLVLKNRSSIHKSESHVIWSAQDWTPWTLTIYLFGMITGMVGLISVVSHRWSDHQIVQITAAFGSVTGFIVLVCLLMLCCCCGSRAKERRFKLFKAMIFTIMMVCALYSDWILGDIAGSLVGVPSGDASALYWTYFAAKRLPLLMS